MKYSQWESIYERIAVDLKIDKKEDETAAEILNQLISTYQKYYVNWNDFFDLIKNNIVYIFGAAPSLDHDIKTHYHLFKDECKVAADGATSALIKYDMIPHIIVTDLDGVIPDQLKANRKGSIIVAHAHADNIQTIQKTIPIIKGPFVGTVQTDPSQYEYVKNFGGFTDGDRAVFLAEKFQAKKIILVGFDCDADPGFYSFHHDKDLERKKKKLKWCKQLLSYFPENYLLHI